MQGVRASEGSFGLGNGNPAQKSRELLSQDPPLHLSRRRRLDTGPHREGTDKTHGRSNAPPGGITAVGGRHTSEFPIAGACRAVADVRWAFDDRDRGPLISGTISEYRQSPAPGPQKAL